MGDFRDLWCIYYIGYSNSPVTSKDFSETFLQDCLWLLQVRMWFTKYKCSLFFQYNCMPRSIASPDTFPFQSKTGVRGVWNFKSLKKAHELVLLVARRTKKLGDLIVGYERKGVHVGKFKDLPWLTFFSFPLLLSTPFIYETTGICVSFVPVLCSSLSTFYSPLVYKTSIIPMRASRRQPAPLVSPPIPCNTVAVYLSN